MNGPVLYSEPGSEPRQANDSSAQVSLAPNPLARLFARLINGAIWIGAGLLLLLGSVAVIGGIAFSEIWPLLNELTVAELSAAERIIADALAESFADYRVRDAVLIALIPIAAALLWVILRLLYLCLLVRFAGGDLGHLAMGMRILSYRDGLRPSFGQALGRAMLKQLDVLIIPWLFNGVMTLANREGRHSYDFIAGTIVVREGWTMLPLLEPKPEYLVITDPQLHGDTAIPLPPSRG